MKAIKNVVITIIVGLFLLSTKFAVVMADTTYTYTGKKFTNSTGKYKTSYKVTGSFTLPYSLKSNETYSFFTPFYDLIFSFSDGVNKLNDKNSSFSVHVETDSNSNIKKWDLTFWKYEPDLPRVGGTLKQIDTMNLSRPSTPSDQGFIGTCLEVNTDPYYCSDVLYNGLGITTDKPGTWKIKSETAGSSSLTGFQISKSGRFLEYGAGFNRRAPDYLGLVVPTYGACAAAPIPANLSCEAVALEIFGISLFEGYNLFKIAFDPPDPLYSEIFQPRQYPAFTLDSSSGLPQELIDAANSMLQDRTEMASLLEAWRVTLERYNAAQADNDLSSMSLQSRALDNYIIQTSRLATLAQQSFDEFLDQLEEFTGPVLISPDQMQEAMDNLAANGFSQLVLDRLSSFGLRSAEVEELRSMLLQAPPLSDTVDFYSSMRSTEGSYGELSAITRYVSENNQPPVVQCHDVTVSANNSCKANANVDNGSYDPDGDPITLIQSPLDPYVLGSTGVTLTTTDSNGASASCSATVTVVDTTPPMITSVAASSSVLWPPSHKMIPVQVNAATLDNCTAAPICKITSVSSNEPNNGLGDGDTAPDWQITGDLIVNLRAERSGTGTGRVYTVKGECTDVTGNSTPWSTTVAVPHDQGKK